MSRFEIEPTVQRPYERGERSFITVGRTNTGGGLTVAVFDTDGTTPLTVYAAESGGTTLANPLTSDPETGRIEGWLEEDDIAGAYYTLEVSAADESVETYVQRVRLSSSAGSGSGVESGAGAPDNAVGDDGAFYVDTLNSRLYGPKASGVWPGTYVSMGVGNTASLPAGTGLIYAQTTRPAQGTFSWEWIEVDDAGAETGYREVYTYDPSVAKDTFTDTAGVTLASHTPEIGTSWTKHGSYPSGAIVITDANRARLNVSSAETCYYVATDPASAEYDVLADFLVKTHFGGGAFPGVVGRIATGANTMYTATLNEGAKTWSLSKIIAGVETTLATSAAQTYSDGDTLSVKLQIRDATKKLFINGVELLSSADNAITAKGKAGFRGYYASAPTNTTGVHFDRFFVRNP